MRAHRTTPTCLPEVVDLGRAEFAAVHARMRALAAEVRTGSQPGAVLLVEHDPVFTAGRAAAPGEAPPGAVEIERGGRVTYHGPGQLVVYPVVALPRRDVRAWLRALEQFGVAVCATFGVTATPSLDGTGVFVGHGKVASIGVAVRGWVNLHGIAINVDMDLTPFTTIRPCGLDGSRMTDLSRAAGRTVTLADAKRAARDQLADLLAVAPRPRP